MIAQKISPLSLLVSQCLRLRIALCMHVCVLVPQSCLTLCDPMECSPSGSSVHGILQAKNTGVGCQALLQVIFPQGLNPGLSGSLPLAPPGKPWYEHEKALKYSKHTKQNRWVRQNLPHSRCFLPDMLRCTGFTASLQFLQVNLVRATSHQNLLG